MPTPWKKTADLVRRNRKEIEALSGAPVDQQRLVNVALRFNQLLSLPTTDEAVGATFHSLKHLLGTTPDTVTLRESFRKIASNTQFIMKGMPIPLWEGNPVEVTIGIVSVQKKEHKGKHIMVLQYRVLSGIPAGMLLELTAPSWWVHRVLTRKAGAWKIRHSVRAEDIAGCILQCVLAVEGPTSSITWRDIKTSNSEKERNNELIKARYGQRPCGAYLPCRLCPKTRDQCRLAVFSSVPIPLSAGHRK